MKGFGGTCLSCLSICLSVLLILSGHKTLVQRYIRDSYYLVTNKLFVARLGVMTMAQGYFAKDKSSVRPF